MGNLFTSNISTKNEGAKQQFAGFDVTVIWPVTVEAQGVTFLLPGAMVRLSEYNSTAMVLLEKGQVVLSFYMNVLLTSHDKFTDAVFQIFQEFHAKNPHLPERFNLVGHSVGGKIALLVACRCVSTKPELVKLVLALDPVDERPPEFTNNVSNEAANKTFEHVTASVHITWATAAPQNKIAPNHNAQAIYDANARYLSSPLIRHQDAGHFAYTDHGGGLPGKLIIAGTPEGNKNARDDAHSKIRELF